MKQKQNYDKEARQYIKQNHKGFLENIDDRPYLMWVVVVDNRTCELCRALDGCVFPLFDPIWKEKQGKGDTRKSRKRGQI
jgi:hypothetical protein